MTGHHLSAWLLLPAGLVVVGLVVVYVLIRRTFGGRS